jgi:amino acid adenylation domain-containing protein
VRCHLLQLGAQDHVLLLVMHHLVFDGWSAGLLLRELAQACAGSGRHEGVPAGGPAQPQQLQQLQQLQYSDYAAWQRDWLRGDVLDAELAWWRQRLAGTETLRLPCDFPRPALQAYRGDRVGVRVSPETGRGLRQLGATHGATPFMTLLAALQALLARYSGQRDIVVGTPVAGRSHRETEHLVGCFINLLPLRTQLQPDAGFATLLAQVRDTTLDAYAHQELPFEKLVQQLALPRDASRAPLFQVLFTLQNLPAAPLAFGALQVEAQPLGQQHALYDLSLTVAEMADGAIEGELEYNTDLFAAATAQRLARHWQQLLAAVVEAPEAPLQRLPLMDVAEQAQWRALARGAMPRPGTAATVHEAFALQAESTPAAVAIEQNATAVRYCELEARANQLANRLSSLPLRAGEIVALLLPRSPRLVTAMLAVLKAGAAYLPLDPALPAARVQELLADSGTRVLVTDAAGPSVEPGVLRLDLDADAAALARLPTLAPALPPTDPRQAAYLIYTSGSTGRPKGVRVPHSALLNHAAWAVTAYEIEPGERLLQFASPGFDVAAEEIFPTLSRGATLVLRDDEALAPDRFGSWVERQRIAVLNLPTAFWHSWVKWLERSGTPVPAGVRLLVIGGERASRSRHQAWSRLPGASAVRWLNAYGPTEATITATVFDPARVPALHPDAELPIGRPVHGVRAYVLDALRQPALPGAPGELYLGGACVALGYWQRPDAEAAAFGPDPFASDPDARMYRTGDLCRWRGDGELEFLGRVDDQLKLRGFRIEPGEVEAALTALPGIAQAAVVACAQGDAGGRSLVGWLVGTEMEVRGPLAARLPDYMIPSAFLWRASLPLTPNGKVDRELLRAEAAAALAVAAAGEREGAPPPRDQFEQGVADIFGEVLGLQRVGRHDDFFALGGHSLIALRAIALLEERFARRLPVASLFMHPSVAALAERLRSPDPAQGAGLATLETLQTAGAGLPFFCVAPGPTGALCYAGLARHLGTSRPFHVLSAPDDGAASRGDLATIAERYVAAIRQRQPQGPYLVGGWSLGGVLAFEIAGQLQAAGQQVDRLVLIDSIAPGAEPDPYVLPTDPAQRLRQLAAALPDADLDAVGIQTRLATYGRHLDAAARYVPSPAPFSITLLKARDLPVTAAASLSELLRENALGWSRHSQHGVEVEPVAGDHLSMLSEPCVQPLALRLHAILEAADSTVPGRPRAD